MNIFRRVILTLGFAIWALCLKILLCGSLGELASIRDRSDLSTALARQERIIKTKMSLVAQSPNDYEVMSMRLSNVTSWMDYLRCIERIKDLWK